MLNQAQQVSPLDLSVVRIFHPTGEVVGAGFCIGAGQVATCAHVVSAVLGGDPEDDQSPTGRVRIDWPLVSPARTADAVVRSWCPIDPVTGAGDVAVLDVVASSPLPGPVPPLFRPQRLWGHRFRVIGFPAGMQDGVWAAGELRDRQGTRWLQLQSDPHGPSIVEGFSGAPVWDEEVQAVVGMTVASDVSPGSTTAYLLPIEDVIGVDPGLLPNPYRGLEPFGEEHADLFHGRESDADRLLAMLDRRALVAVVGRSGTGKSSLVRAGLVPRLRRRGFRVVDYRPGSARQVAAATLAQLGGTIERLLEGDGDHGILLFADQFEELVGTAPAGEGPTPAQEILQGLVAMVSASPNLPDGSPALRVVLTLRWEAMNELLAADAVEVFQQGTLTLAPMSRDQLRQAIVGPAARAPGLQFDPGLVDRMLDDAVAEPGQLPLVGSLLTQLWESRHGGTLEMSAYEQIGGVRGAVARHAELAVGPAMAGAEGDAVRRLFTTLARPDEGTGFVGRVARLEGLDAGQIRIVEDLARSHLLIVGQETDGQPVVELAHQALIDHWPRLQSWLEEDRDFLVWQHDVDRQRQRWQDGGRDSGALLRGLALARAEQWLRQRGDDVPPPTRELVEASLRRRRRDTRRRRGLLATVSAALVLALLLGTLFVSQRRLTGREQARSDSRALAALSADSVTSDPAWSILLALAAYDRHPTPEAEQALFQQYVAYNTVDGVLSGTSAGIIDIEVSRDGRVVVALTRTGSVSAWRREPGRPVSAQQLEVGQVYLMDLSDDGSQILLAGQQGTQVYDLAAGATAWKIPVDPADVSQPVIGGGGMVELRVSPAATAASEGQADAQPPAPGPPPDHLELWAPGSGGEGRLVGRLDGGSTGDVTVVGFGTGPDELLLWTADPPAAELRGRLRSWNARTGALDTVLPAVAYPPVLTPEGVVVSCARDSGKTVVRRFDLRAGTDRSFPLPDGTLCPINGPAVDAAGEVAVLDDRDVDLRSGRVTGQMPLPKGTFLDAALFTDGNHRFAVRSNGSSVVIREVLTENRTLPAQRSFTSDAPILPPVADAQLLPGGEQVLTVTGDVRQLVVSRLGGDPELVATAIRPGLESGWQPPHPRMNRKGTLVADRVSPDTVQVRRLPGLDLLGEVSTEPVDADEAGDNGVWDGDLLLTYDWPIAKWWDPASAKSVAELDVAKAGIVPEEATDSYVRPYPPDGHLAVVGAVGDPDLHIVEIATGRQVDAIAVGGDVLATVFQDDGRYFVVLRQGSSVEMWDRAKRRRVLGPLRSLGDSSPRANDGILQFLPESGRILVGNAGQLQWYEAGTAAPVRRLSLGAGRAPISASSDGSSILHLYTDVYDFAMPPLSVDPAVWRRTLCDVIDDRALTDDERRLLPPGAGRGPLC